MQITSAPSPALKLAREYAWLVDGSSSAVLAIKPVSPDALQIVVGDADATATKDSPGSQVVADTAAGMLEPVVAGVKLLVTTPGGSAGRPAWYTGDENAFATSLPGVVSQVIESEYDVDGDGEIAEDEAAYLFPVDSADRAAKLDRILRDEYGDYPVRFEVWN